MIEPRGRLELPRLTLERSRSATELPGCITWRRERDSNPRVDQVDHPVSSGRRSAGLRHLSISGTAGRNRTDDLPLRTRVPDPFRATAVCIGGHPRNRTGMGNAQEILSFPRLPISPGGHVWWGTWESNSNARRARVFEARVSASSTNSPWNESQVRRTALAHRKDLRHQSCGDTLVAHLGRRPTRAKLAQPDAGACGMDDGGSPGI